jgi:hypothetical protein
MRNKFEVHDAGPLLIAMELLILPRFVIEALGFFDSA